MSERGRLLRAAIALAVLLVLMRVPALLTPVTKVDEALYAASAARSVALGDPLPYRASWQDKGPVILWIYMAVFALFGNFDMFALHLAALLIVGLGAFAAYRIGCAASSSSGGLWAAFLYIVGMNTGNAIPFNSETPAVVAGLWALAILIRLREPGRREMLAALAAGALGGVAFFTRQNFLALLLGLPVCAALLVWQRGGRPAEILKLALVTAGGFLLPCALIVGVFAAAGEFPLFYENFWGLNQIYVGVVQMSVQRYLGIPNEIMRMFLRTAQTPVLLGLLGIGLLLAVPLGRGIFEGRQRIVAALTALLAVGFTLAGVPGYRFFNHYFVMAVPFWAVLAGATVGTLQGLLKVPGLAGPARFAIVAGCCFDLSGTPFFETWLDTLRFARYGGLQNRSLVEKGLGLNDDVSRISKTVRNLSRPNDTMFVWGFAPFFHVQTGLIPATRIGNGCYLSGLVPWENVSPEIDTKRWEVPGAWDAAMADLHANRPVFLIDSSRHFLFASGKYPMSRYPRLEELVKNDYTLVRSEGAHDLWVRKDRAPADASFD